MDSTNTIHVATRKGWFEFRKINNQWELVRDAFPGVPVSMTLASANSDIYYAALNHGHFGVKLHCSTNAGKSWGEIGTPKYDVDDVSENPPSLELIWSMEYAGGADKEKLWIGTIPGGLFFSADGGESWELNQSLWNVEQRKHWFGGGYDQPGIHSICVDPRDHQRVGVAVSCAGIWITEDGGDNWKIKSLGMRAEYMPPEQTHDPYIQDPHKVVQSPKNPDVYWTQHHNGIFRSIDNSESWQEVTTASPSHFGFAVVTHPENEDMAWFVPAIKDECRIPVDGKLVVSHTKDGGKTFTEFTEGLPQKNAYDLIYRHGLDIDATGNCLVMGSTTGNLWISENQGKSWSLVSQFLPPIYSVRFLK